MAEEIINRVANSKLVSFNLEEYYAKGERQVFDIRDWLYQGMILKEKDFRNYVKDHDWAQYQGMNVAIVCSADAIIPTWAYMLIGIKLEPYANMFVFGSKEGLENALFQQALSKIDINEYRGAKVVIKGCGDIPVPDYAYVEITRLLRPHVSSIMYGEPCSTVPLYKAGR